tara:strand:- start:3139 stop:3294 length:156 start_codon:yes stop_codon:yes gene_type:complete
VAPVTDSESTDASVTVMPLPSAMVLVSALIPKPPNNRTLSATRNSTAPLTL